jgi:endonuclease/exonuclease/phosphatase family metal-dependent hydrolase
MTTYDRPYSHRNRWGTALLLASVAVGLILWTGAQRQRGEPRVGVHLRAAPGDATTTQPAPQSSRLRVASFNIQSGRGDDGRTDLARTSLLLPSFDLIGLNEAQGHVVRLARPADQVQELAALLRLPWLFAASERRWWTDDFGNGLLCGWPVEHWSIIPLPGERASGYRNLVHARVHWNDDVTMNVLITHLDHTTDRTAQLAMVSETFLAMQEPVILMGDLNTRGSEPALKALLGRAGVIDPIGDTPQLASSERIDWILVRGLTALDGGVTPTKASDHPLVWAELELPPLPTVERANGSTARPRGD